MLVILIFILACASQAGKIVPTHCACTLLRSMMRSKTLNFNHILNWPSASVAEARALETLRTLVAEDVATGIECGGDLGFSTNVALHPIGQFCYLLFQLRVFQL